MEERLPTWFQLQGLRTLADVVDYIINLQNRISAEKERKTSELNPEEI